MKLFFNFQVPENQKKNEFPNCIERQKFKTSKYKKKVNSNNKKSKKGKKKSKAIQRFFKYLEFPSFKIPSTNRKKTSNQTKLLERT